MGELIDVGVAGGKKSGDDAASTFGEHPTVSAGYSFDQSVSAQQCEFAGDGGGLSALFIEQRLGADRITDPHKAVVALRVAEARLGHLVGRPLPAVQADIHAEGKPGLHPHMAQPELLVQ